MTKRDLVMAALAGREANRVPLAVTTQTSPRNYPGSCSQRAPKKPKGDDMRSANLRGVVCGALALVSIRKGLITQRSLVQIQPPQPRRDEG